MDLLAKLEKSIIDYYLGKGYKLEKDQEEKDPKWGFTILTKSQYKFKEITIVFQEEGQEDDILTIRRTTTSEMFSEAMKYYTMETGDNKEEHY